MVAARENTMTTQSQVDRLSRDIASLGQSDAREAEKEAKANLD